MLGGSKLTYEQIMSLAEQLKSAANQMDALLNNDIQSLFRLIGTEEIWAGVSASHTREQFDTLSAKFPQFVQAIDDCHRYLMKVVENYRSVDQSVIGNSN